MLVTGVVVAVWVAPAAWARATSGARTTADEPHYIMTAISLAEDRSLDVSDERAAGRYRPFHEVGLPLQEETQTDGSRISPHDPLLPALLAVPVATGGWLAGKLTLALMAGGLAALLVWTAVRRFGVSLRVALVVVLASSTAAPLAIYGTQVYPELAAALAVTVAIAALTGPLGRGGLMTFGLAIVALPWLSVKYAPVAAALVVVALVGLVRGGDRRRAALLAGGLALAAAAFAVAHVAWYGGLTPYAAGAHFTAGELTVAGDPDVLGRAPRLLGLLVDRGFGLVAWAPVFLLVVPAVAALARRRPPGTAALLLPLTAGWLTATFVALTMHGWWWPGRQVVVVLPAAVLALAWWAANVPSVRLAVIVAGVVGALTFAWVVAEALAGRITLVVDFESTTAIWHRAIRPVLPDGRATPAGTTVLQILWLAVLAAAAALGWRSAAPTRASRPTRAVLAAEHGGV